MAKRKPTLKELKAIAKAECLFSFINEAIEDEKKREADELNCDNLEAQLKYLKKRWGLDGLIHFMKKRSSGHGRS